MPLPQFPTKLYKKGNEAKKKIHGVPSVPFLMPLNHEEGFKPNSLFVTKGKGTNQNKVTTMWSLLETHSLHICLIFF